MRSQKSRTEQSGNVTKGRVRWRDTFGVWPSVRVQIELAPWAWRLRWYRDDIEPTYLLSVGPLTIELWANRGWFPLERGPVGCSAACSEHHRFDDTCELGAVAP